MRDQPPVVANPYYCRTFTATRRHIIRPGTGNDMTLCGQRVFLTDEYVADGELKHPEPWMIVDQPPCQRCERSATRHGITR